jgi:hypothetical protein
MITKRDAEILDFIELLGAASLSQIKRRFISDKSQGEVIARRRMKRLYDMKMVKRERSFINTEYIYFQKNTLLEHKLTLTEFNVRLQELTGKILKFDVEKPLGDIRPDACCDYLFNNKVYQFFIETKAGQSGLTALKCKSTSAFSKLQGFFYDNLKSFLFHQPIRFGLPLFRKRMIKAVFAFKVAAA